MKVFLLMLVYSIIHVNAFASYDQKNEKKILIKFIKAEYDSWNGNSEEISGSDDSLILCSSETVNDLERSGREKTKTVQDASKKHEFHFDNSKFTIATDQAIVEFVVDDQKFSAFFEKANNEWELILAAKIGH